MAKILIVCGILMCFYLRGGQGVKCFKCGYVEGLVDWDLTPDCVNNLNSDTVQFEEGVACVKATGRSGGRSFVFRDSFNPRHQQVNNNFPTQSGQKWPSCDSASVVVTRVGQNKVDAVDTCHLCNDKEGCNGATFVTFNLGVLFSFVLLSLW